MHILRMILEHLVVCKAVDFALHQLWMVVKKAFDLAVTMLFLWFFASILKEADRIWRGFGFVVLLIAAGVFSGASFRLATRQQSIAA
jgi:hypothetical protein